MLDAPRGLGYNTYGYKLAAFVIAGALGAFGGVLNANLNAHVSPAMLHWILSGDLLVMIILGGVGTVLGPVVGAAAFILLEESLSAITKHWMVILGPHSLLPCCHRSLAGGDGEGCREAHVDRIVRHPRCVRHAGNAPAVDGLDATSAQSRRRHAAESGRTLGI